MAEDKELEKLLTVGKTLDEKIHIVELNLISFCDLYKEYVLTVLRKSDGKPETIQTLTDEMNMVNALQVQFADFKTKFNIKLSSVPRH